MPETPDFSPRPDPPGNPPGRVSCSHCGLPLAGNERYCPRCGEPLAPDLLAELHWRYAVLRDLDARLAAGQGARPVADLYAEYRAQYVALRQPPIPRAAPGQAGPSPAPSGAAAPVSSPLAQSAPPLDAVAPGVTTAQAGPIFTWRAFLAEQAISLMAYLGGFLLLVATLSFEVGGWQVLSNLLKLVAVGAVYGIFGALGFALRRTTHLRMVGGAYLGVFALMTPLVALAAYLFALHGAFTLPEMVCISALYAAAIYLILAARVRFAPYAYLGWAATLTAALAGVPWTGAGPAWYLFALALTSLALLVPHALTRRMQREAFVFLAVPAMQLAAVCAPVAALATIVLGIIGEVARIVGLADSLPFLVAAYALTACVLVPLAIAWSLTLRALRGSADAPSISAVSLDVLDWLAIALSAHAAVALSLWAGATVPELALLLAALAGATFAAAAVLARAQTTRGGLRYGAEALALGLAAVSALLVADRPHPTSRSSPRCWPRCWSAPESLLWSARPGGRCRRAFSVSCCCVSSCSRSSPPLPPIIASTRCWPLPSRASLSFCPCGLHASPRRTR